MRRNPQCFDPKMRQYSLENKMSLLSTNVVFTYSLPLRRYNLLFRLCEEAVGYVEAIEVVSLFGEDYLRLDTPG
jgi:hypothetical protein